MGYVPQTGMLLSVFGPTLVKKALYVLAIRLGSSITVSFSFNPLSAGPVYIRECHSVCVDASRIFTGMDMTK